MKSLFTDTPQPAAITQLMQTANVLRKYVEAREKAILDLDLSIASHNRTYQSVLQTCREGILDGKFSLGSNLLDNYVLHVGFSLDVMTGLFELNKRFQGNQGNYLCVVIAERQYCSQEIELRIHAIVGRIEGELEIIPDSYAKSLKIGGLKGFKITLPTSAYCWDQLSLPTQIGRAGADLHSLDEPESTDLTGSILAYAGSKTEDGWPKIESIQMGTDSVSITDDAMGIFAGLQKDPRGRKILCSMDEQGFRALLESSFKSV